MILRKSSASLISESPISSSGMAVVKQNELLGEHRSSQNSPCADRLTNKHVPMDGSIASAYMRGQYVLVLMKDIV